MNEKLELVEDNVAFISTEGPYSVYKQMIFEDEIRVIYTDDKLIFPIVDIAQIIGSSRQGLHQLIKRKRRHFEDTSVIVTLTEFGGQKRNILCVDEEGVSMLILSMNIDRIKEPWRREVIFELQKWAHRLVAGVFFRRVRIDDPQRYLPSFPKHINDIQYLYKLRQIHSHCKGEIMAAYCQDNRCHLATAYARLKAFKEGRKYYDYGKNKGKMTSIKPKIEKKLISIVRKHPHASALKIKKIYGSEGPCANTILKWLKINRKLVVPDNDYIEFYKRGKYGRIRNSQLTLQI